MPSESDLLPRFHHPPVDEVALGVQFAAPGFLPIHYGAYYERVKSDYPSVQSLPAIPQVIESFSAPSEAGELASPNVRFEFGTPRLPRVLFVSNDDCSLIQLQSNGLYFNWRRRPDKEYAHYQYLRDGFSKAYNAFESFVADQGFGPIAASQCDIVYVNPLPSEATGVKPSSPEQVFRVWNAEIGEEWSEPLEDLSFNARYRLVDDAGEPFGRLTATMQTGIRPGGMGEMRLELIARGTPRGLGLDGILAFHDIGHEAIVRAFAALTTPAMHKRWDRYQ